MVYRSVVLQILANIRSSDAFIVSTIKPKNKTFCTAVIILLQILDCYLNKSWMRTSLFWVRTQRVVVISYRRFGTTYRSHFKGQKITQELYVFRGLVPHNISWPESTNTGMSTSGTKFILSRFVNSQVSKPVYILKCRTDMQACTHIKHADLKSPYFY